MKNFISDADISRPNKDPTVLEVEVAVTFFVFVWTFIFHDVCKKRPLEEIQLLFFVKSSFAFALFVTQPVTKGGGHWRHVPPPAFEQNLCFCLHNIFPLNLADVPLLKGGGGAHKNASLGGAKFFVLPPARGLVTALPSLEMNALRRMLNGAH